MGRLYDGLVDRVKTADEFFGSKEGGFAESLLSKEHLLDLTTKVKKLDNPYHLTSALLKMNDVLLNPTLLRDNSKSHEFLHQSEIIDKCLMALLLAKEISAEEETENEIFRVSQEEAIAYEGVICRFTSKIYEPHIKNLPQKLGSLFTYEMTYSFSDYDPKALYMQLPQGDRRAIKSAQIPADEYEAFYQSIVNKFKELKGQELDKIHVHPRLAESIMNDGLSYVEKFFTEPTYEPECAFWKSFEKVFNPASSFIEYILRK